MSTSEAKLAAIAALEGAAKLARREILGRKLDGRAEWSAISPETYTPLVPFLQTAAAVESLNGQMVTHRHGASLFDLKYVALHLIHRAITTPASAIVEDFVRICEARSAQFIEVALLSDIRVSAPIDIGEGYRLSPLSEVPTTELTAPLLEPTNVPAHGWGSPPTAAVTLSGAFDLLVQAPPPPGSPAPFPTQVFEGRWKDALDAIILASDGAPQFHQRYTLFSSPGWFWDSCPAFGSSEGFPVPGRPVTRLDVEVLKQAFSCFKNGNATIALAMRTLEQARRRISDVERALDYGLCAEILLMSGSKDNSEISFKIATRAAWLLGQTAAERVQIFQDARALYKDRSTSAHTGSLGIPKSMDESMKRLEAFRSSDRLCARLILKLAQDGLPHNWNLVTLNAI